MGKQSQAESWPGATIGPGMCKPACPAHCRYSNSSTLMTLVGMEGRGCCSTSEPNHLARPTGELLLWLGRCSSWECMWDRPDRLGTFWELWTLTAAAWEPEPGGCKTMEIRVVIESMRKSSSVLGLASLKLAIKLEKPTRWPLSPLSCGQLSLLTFSHIYYQLCWEFSLLPLEDKKYQKI